MEAIDAKRHVKPRRSFLGKSMAKSFSWHRDVRIERKKTNAVIEKQRATKEAMAKASNAGLSARIGLPVFSSRPPGTVADVAKATVATSTATSEHDSDVLLSHLLPFSTSFLCDSMKTSLAVCCFVL